MPDVITGLALIVGGLIGILFGGFVVSRRMAAEFAELDGHLAASDAQRLKYQAFYERNRAEYERLNRPWGAS